MRVLGMFEDRPALVLAGVLGIGALFGLGGGVAVGLAGDAVLRQAAQRLRQALREGDIIARYGGEELLVVLPDTALAQAQELATEHGGPSGPEPTRYGDWEKKGLAVDF